MLNMVGTVPVTSMVSLHRVAPARGIALGLAVALCSLSPLAHAQEPSGSPAASSPAAQVSDKAPALRAAVQTLAEKVKELDGTAGVAIVDVGTGELLAAYEASAALNPASNAKLLTAAAALAKLRPSHRYLTALYGKVKNGRVGPLVLRGSGDPSLSSADLWELAHSLKGAGVKRIDGDLLVDQRFFDESFVPPAFEQQPNEWAAFRAPVSAVSLNSNTITLTVRPGAKDGAAFASFDPPGFVDVEGSIKTSSEGAQSITLNLKPSGTRLIAQIGGSIPEPSKPLSFTKRVDNPQLLAGYALKAILAEVGISVAGEVKLGGDKIKAPAIAVHRSKPLSALLYELGKQSDNFYAEMIFKSLGLEQKGRPAKAADGAEVVTAFLNELGVMEDGVVVKNGSGLFDANRVTASSLAKLLRASYREPAWSSEFVAQLSIGGQDGTLRSRFRDNKHKAVVRAKTGTLDAVTSLSGYVLAPPGRDPIAFAIMVNGISGKVSSARPVIDRCVAAIVEHLWK